MTKKLNPAPPEPKTPVRKRGPFRQRFDPKRLKWLADRRGVTLSQLSVKALLKPYTASRITTGKQILHAPTAVIIAGAWNCDLRNLMFAPKDDGLDIAAEIAAELETKLLHEYEESGDPLELHNDPQMKLVLHAIAVMENNDHRAAQLKEIWHDAKRDIFLELGELQAARLDPQWELIVAEKKVYIEELFETLGSREKHLAALPFISPDSEIDTAAGSFAWEAWINILANSGDKSAKQVVIDKAIDAAVDSGGIDFDKIAEAVSPAPPPPQAARPAAKDLPVYGQARAGRDGFDLPADAEAMQHIARPYFLDGVGSAYAVYCNGDSMEPRYQHGQLLFVDPSKPPTRGDDVVIQVQSGDELCGFVKRFVSASDKKTTVHQFNPDEKITYPTPDVKAIHLVVGSLAAGR